MEYMTSLKFVFADSEFVFESFSVGYVTLYEFAIYGVSVGALAKFVGSVLV
jgi:hypothetical protein